LLSASSVIKSGSAAGTSAIHSTDIPAGGVPVGRIGSVIIMSCVTVI